MSTAIGPLVVKCPACSAGAGLACRELTRDREADAPYWKTVSPHETRIARADHQKQRKVSA